MRRAEHIERFTEEIWKWYAEHKRDLPWRDLQVKDDTQRAYMIWVSEVMLQQTQVERVKVIFKRFLEEFPSLPDLALASNREVILAWRGMGYNSRALRLRDGAKMILGECDGIFPQEMEDLQSIKGIGHYTAAAIRNFAFNLPTPCLDTNIRRVLHRTFVGAEDGDGMWRKDDGYLLKLAERVLAVALRRDAPWRVSTERSTANWHAALMDFGSLVCTKTNPKWDICPLAKAGLMKAAFKVEPQKKTQKKEPGRLVGSKFIPNRIFRGKLIDELRDTQEGLTLEELGKRVCLDWSPAEHKAWLTQIMKKLQADELLMKKGKKYQLSF